MLGRALLIEFRVIEGSEVRRPPSEHPDQPQLPGNAVDGEAETQFARELEPILGLPLDFAERISRGETIRD